jgi:hypothetical protein
MAKTAYLYTFHPTTRVVADPSDFKNEEDLYEYLSIKAREQMLSNGIGQYLCGDNGEYSEDTECPYGTLEKDE